MENTIILENFQGRNYMHVKELCLYKESEGFLSLPLFVVYKNQKDFPGKYVIRLWQINRKKRGMLPTAYCAVGDTLEEVREALPQNLCRFSRSSSEDISVIEKWI